MSLPFNTSAKPTLALLAPWLLLVTACASDPDPVLPQILPEPAAPEPAKVEVERPTTILRGSQVELGASPAFDEIARLEYQRSTGNGRLLALLKHEDDRVRTRAAEACGRLPYPAFGSEVTDAVSLLLEDAVPAVRHAAAFSLGLRGDLRAAGTLASYRNDPDPMMRARVFEAASRLPDPTLHTELLIGLRDVDPRVRIETAIATARWDSENDSAEVVDRALLDALRPYQLRPAGTDSAGRHIEPEFVWRVLYALSRRRAELGRGAFLEYASAPGALERLFAVRGLARIEIDDETGPALAAALLDPEADWRVAYEAAIGLGGWDDRGALEALLQAVEHPNVHVRAAAMSSLGSFEGGQEVLAKLRRGQLDVSTEVRVASLDSLSKLLNPISALEVLTKESRSEDAVLRAGAASACANLEDPGAVPLLEALARDPDPRVATTAIGSLASHINPATRAFLIEMLKAPDNGKRLAAVLSLRETAEASDREALEQVFRTSQGDISNEIAFNVLQNLGEIGDAPSRDFVKAALKDSRSYVRQVARDVLASKFGETPAPESSQALGARESAPIAGTDYPRYRFNPLIEVVTSRGSLVFELFPAEAPVHVHNFIELAKREDYDGLMFHRVVPDFVVQGGDYRGDGNGGRPWNGASVPQEFTKRKTTRGSLGMPRNDDPESGGSQFFVTHRPTPHLDGRYTIFGELRQGGDVLDRIEVGDRILTVRPMR